MMTEMYLRWILHLESLHMILNSRYTPCTGIAHAQDKGRSETL